MFEVDLTDESSDNGPLSSYSWLCLEKCHTTNEEEPDRYQFESYSSLYIDIMGHMPEKNGYSEKIPN